MKEREYTSTVSPDIINELTITHDLWLLWLFNNEDYYNNIYRKGKIGTFKGFIINA